MTQIIDIVSIEGSTLVVDVIVQPIAPIIVVEVFNQGPPGPPGPVAEAPEDGELYARQDATWQMVPKITVGTTAPVSPGVNDVWIDTN